MIMLLKAMVTIVNRFGLAYGRLLAVEAGLLLASTRAILKSLKVLIFTYWPYIGRDRI
jgi:hypothetical protein